MPLDSHIPTLTILPPPIMERKIDDIQRLTGDFHRRHEWITASLRMLQERVLLRQAHHRTRFLDLGFDPPRDDGDELLLLEIQQLQATQSTLGGLLEMMDVSLGQRIRPEPSDTALHLPRAVEQRRFAMGGSSPRNSAPIDEQARTTLTLSDRAVRSPTQDGVRQGVLPHKRPRLPTGPLVLPAKRKKPATESVAQSVDKQEGEEQITVANLPSRKLATPVPMAVKSDYGKLSSLQVLIRESLEFFECGPDGTSPTAMRCHKKVIRPYQVGIRCKYCAHIPLQQRRKAAVSYPKTLVAVYRASQNIASTHLLDDAEEGCPYLPETVKHELEIQRPQRDASNVGVPYWVETCRSVGVEEADDALWFTNEKADEECKEG